MILNQQLVFNPRNVNLRHGTGVQLSYLVEEFPEAFRLFNYGAKEIGHADVATLLDSRLISVWPFNYRGRRIWSRLFESSPFSWWRRDCLTGLGRRRVVQIFDGLSTKRAIVVVHDEATAKRFNSIQSLLNLDYTLISYDLMHLPPITAERFPELSNCFRCASRVFALSSALEEVGLELGAKLVKPINFFRPPAVSVRKARRDFHPEDIRIFLLADAKREAFEDLVLAMKRFRSTHSQFKLNIHYVGRDVDYIPKISTNEFGIVNYGFLSAEDRDQVAVNCDFAFLAGPSQVIEDSPLSLFSIPSKIGDFCVLGLPILARVAKGGAADKTISGRLKAFARSATNEDELFHCLSEFVLNPEKLFAMRELCLEFAQSYVVLPAAAQVLVR